MLAVLRDDKGLSRVMVAGALGVPVATVRRWEDGTRSPRPAGRKRIRTAYAALGELDGVELAHAVLVRCSRLARASTQPVSLQIEAMGAVAGAANLVAQLTEAYFAWLDQADRAEAAKPSRIGQHGWEQDGEGEGFGVPGVLVRNSVRRLSRSDGFSGKKPLGLARR